MQALPPTTTTAKNQRPRSRIPLSCTECRRRKQRCNQAKDQPCNHCARRYPPVICRYENSESVSPHRGEFKVVDKDVTEQSYSDMYLEPQTIDECDEGLGALENHHADTALVRLPLHPKPPVQHGRITPRKGRLIRSSLSSSNRPRRQKENRKLPPLEEDASEDTYVHITLNPFLLPRKGAATYGCPEAYVGHVPVIIEPLPPIPIDNTGRNAELFHFFHLSLSPYIGAIDGLGQSALIKDCWLPWMASSPLMAYTAILSSSLYQAEARGLDVSKFPEAIAIRVKIILMVNEYLKTNAKAVSDEAISAVMHLLVNEWYYGDKKSQLAHMRGLQEMLRLRGGLESVPKSNALYALLATTDYQIACTCERELSLHGDIHFNDPIPPLASYPVAMESPLLQSNIRFQEVSETLGISNAAADILDDMRFLTCSIIALSASERDAQETAKCFTTARWVHDRVTSLPSITDVDSPLAGDFIYETCRIAAIVYSSSILKRVPLSEACGMHDLQAFWAHMPRITLSRWKTLSGIFLWLCLVFSPAAQYTPYGRFLKAMVSSTITYVGLADWGVMMRYLRGFLRVQRWLRRRKLVAGIT